MNPQFLCVKKLLKMANDGGNGMVHLTLKLDHATVVPILYLQIENNHGEKQNNLFIIFFIKFYFTKRSSRQSRSKVSHVLRCSRAFQEFSRLK